MLMKTNSMQRKRATVPFFLSSLLLLITLSLTLLCAVKPVLGATLLTVGNPNPSGAADNRASIIDALNSCVPGADCEIRVYEGEYDEISTGYFQSSIVVPKLRLYADESTTLGSVVIKGITLTFVSTGDFSIENMEFINPTLKVVNARSNMIIKNCKFSYGQLLENAKPPSFEVENYASLTIDGCSASNIVLSPDTGTENMFKATGNSALDIKNSKFDRITLEQTATLVSAGSRDIGTIPPHSLTVNNTDITNSEISSGQTFCFFFLLFRCPFASFERVTFDTIHPIGLGGIIMSFSSKTQLRNSTFKAIDTFTNLKVQSEAGEGAITLMDSSDLEVINCRFEGFRMNSGGIILLTTISGSGASYRGFVRVVSSKFIGNWALNQAAVILVNSFTKLQLSFLDCDFENNIAAKQSIFIVSPKAGHAIDKESFFLVEVSRFIGNSASDDIIGRIDSATLNTTFHRVSFTDNACTECIDFGSTAKSSASMLVTRGRLSILRCAITGNRAGKNIFSLYPEPKLTGAYIRADYSNFTRNMLIFEKGGILNANAKGTISVTNSYFGYNKGIQGTAAWFTGFSIGTFKNVIMEENQATKSAGCLLIDKAARVTIEDSVIKRNFAIFGGVMVVSDVASFTGRNLAMEKNIAKQDSGIFKASGHAFVFIDNSTMVRSTAKHSAVGDVAVNASVTISNSRISSNVASGYNGVLSTSSSGTVSFDNCTLSANKAGLASALFTVTSSDGGGEPYQKLDGSGYLADYGLSIVSNEKFRRDNEQDDGDDKGDGDDKDDGEEVKIAGKFIVKGIDERLFVPKNIRKSHMIISDSVIEKNVVGDFGLMWCRGNSRMHISNSTFKGNEASNTGGVVKLSEAAYLDIVDSIFEDNHASYGGAIVAEQGFPILRISNSTFLSNIAEKQGGAIYISYVQSDEDLFRSANSLKVDGRPIIYIEDSKFESNNAKGDSGGAISVFDSDVIVKGSKFLKNIAAKSGGAVFADFDKFSGQSINFFKCDFLANEAGVTGGAISLMKPNNLKFILDESTVSQNSALIGGGLYGRNLKGMSIKFDISESSKISQNTAKSYGGEFGSGVQKLKFSIDTTDPTVVKEIGGVPILQGYSGMVLPDMEIFVFDAYGELVKSNTDFSVTLSLELSEFATTSTDFLPATLTTTKEKKVGLSTVPVDGKCSFKNVEIYGARGDYRIKAAIQDGRNIEVTHEISIGDSPMYFRTAYKKIDGREYAYAKKDPKIYVIPDAIRFPFIALLSAGLALSVGSILLIYYNRDLKIVKASSPLFCYLSSLGIILGYLTVYLILWQSNEIVCVLRPWMGHISFAVLLGAMFTKAWRIMLIFKNKDSTSIASLVSNSRLMRIFFAVVGFEAAYLTIWTALDRPVVNFVIDNSDDTLQYKQCKCASEWEYGLFILEFMLLMWGSTIAWSTRNVEGNFNESKLIGFSIWNIVFVGGIAIAYTITSDDSFLINVTLCSGCMILVLTTILGLLFGPKFKDIYLTFLFERSALDAPPPRASHLSGGASMASINSTSYMIPAGGGGGDELISDEEMEVIKEEKERLESELVRYKAIAEEQATKAS
eukprot:Nk52_evm54s485 gene=Nk52_evmTU54s485